MRFTPIIFACLVNCTIAAQSETGSAVKVHVISSVTGTPIVGATVVLETEKDDTLSGRTDTGGIFAGRTHSAASHLLTVTRKGYRMTGNLMGKMIEVKAGVETEVTVAMLPLGILAGRVLDQYGDPVSHAIVRAEDRISDGYYDGASRAATDDRGEYRITGVEPGKHYVVVEYSEQNAVPRSRYKWPETGGLVLYPDATDIGQAQQVEAGAGLTTRLKDMHLNIQRAVTISGRIKPPSAENNQSLNLQRASVLALSSSPMVQGGRPAADGTFKIGVLFPGRYVLTASDAKSGKMSKPLLLEVRDKDISNVEVELTSGFEITGRFVVEGQERIDFSKLLLNFLGGPVKIESGGTFRATLFGGKAAYILQGLPEDWYVKDFHVAGRPITGRQFEVEPGSTDLVFTLSPGGARVEINVEGAGGLIDKAYVALLPESGAVPETVESVLQTQADPSGKFIVHAVPPGSYRVFTLDASSWVLLFRPAALLDKYRNLAPLIGVVEGERKSVVVPALKIPAE